MKQVKILSAAVLLALAGTANAGVTSTITATNDYDFRGITQSNEDPALQASVDYAHDSGWYIGAWASTIDFPHYDGDVELDLYTGFTGKINDDTSWDVGIIHYAYPGSSAGGTVLNPIGKIEATTEIYGSIGYKWFKGKLSYTNDIANTNEDAFYIEGAANIPLPANFTLQLHLGHFDISNADYTDYSVGVGYTVSNFNLALKWVDTDRDAPADDGRVIFTVSTTLPWK